MRVGQTRRRDAIEAPMIDAWRAIGLICHRLSVPDCGDVLVIDPWATKGPRHQVIELKSGLRAKVRTNQADAGAGTFWPVVRSIPEGLALYGVRA